MTITSNEVKDTGGLIIDAKESKSTTKRRFVVASDTAGELDTDFQAFKSTGVSLGDPHPDYPTLNAVRVESKRDIDNPLVWRVTFEYESREAIGVINTLPTQFSQKWNMATETVFKDVFRVNDDDPDDIYGTFNFQAASGVDIGGVPIDAAGKPASVQTNRAKLIVEMEVVTRPSEISNYLNTIMDLTGSRNRSSFLGAGPGNLLYQGGQTQTLGLVEDGNERYSIRHSFVFDQVDHKIQIPQISANTEKVRLGKEDAAVRAPGSKISGYLDHAYKVFWKQPFPFTTDFRRLGIRL
jgi:hypothetical protein